MTGPVWPAWQPVEPPPRTAGARLDLFGLALLVGVAVGVVSYSLRAPLGRALGLGAVLTLAGYLTLWLLDRIAAGRAAIRPVPLSALRPAVARWQIPGFAELRGTPNVGLPDTARLRMQEAVTAQLAAQGIELTSDRARELLGSKAYRLLTEYQVTRPSAAEVTELLVAVTGVLDPDGPGQGTPEERTPEERAGKGHGT